MHIFQIMDGRFFPRQGAIGGNFMTIERIGVWMVPLLF
jgi:hypothetical protein